GHDRAPVETRCGKGVEVGVVEAKCVRHVPASSSPSRLVSCARAGRLERWENPSRGRREMDRTVVDLGVWMSPGVLEHKLEAAEERNPEQTWNMGRWPKGLSEKGPHRMFVASDGLWRGYFLLSGEALYNP